uniref:Uncharacterized protein n=1 Tax=Vitis vinifera TaxID=29760 RepID=F6HMQ4_VITVI
MFKHVYGKKKWHQEELHMQGSPTQCLSTKIISALLGVVMSENIVKSWHYLICSVTCGGM